MRINRGFIIGFFVLFLLLILVDIVFLVTGYYHWASILVNSLFVIGLIVLFFRKKPEGTGKFIAYLIPLLILLYVLYWNFVPPAGAYSLDIGREWDADSSRELYIVESSDLGPRQMYDGEYFRELNGVAEVVFNPEAVLRNKNVTIIVEGEGVSIIPPRIEFDPSDYEWDYEWDFTTGIVPEGLEIKTKVDTFELVENAYEYYLEQNASFERDYSNKFDGCLHFDGNTTITFNGTHDMFESEPFAVYVKWKPENDDSSFQQIIGHYNWEISQDKNKVKFFVGRMNNATGPGYSIIYNIKNKTTFFNKIHNIIAIYNPEDKEGNGTIELYVDKEYIGKKDLNGDKIWEYYGAEYPMSLGKSRHETANYFEGCIYEYRVIENYNLKEEKENIKERVVENFITEEGFYFNGKTRLILPESQDMFEEGPFTIYVEWIPEKSNESSQQIVGHYNWRVWQNEDAIIFIVGRMNNASGPSFSVSKKIDEDFFSKEHYLVAIYSPNEESGSIELILDDELIGRTFFGNNTIWKGYGGNNDLSFGLSKHGTSKYYEGTILKSYFTREVFINESQEINISMKHSKETIKLRGSGNLSDMEIRLN